MANKGLLFFYDWRIPFEALSGDETKALLMAMLDYSEFGTDPPQFEGGAKIAAAFLFPALERSKKRAESGRVGGKTTAAKNSASESSCSAEDASRGALSGASSKIQPHRLRLEDKDKDKNKDKDNSIEPPTPATGEGESCFRDFGEARQYFVELGAPAPDEMAREFWAYYTGCDWRAKSGEPIRDQQKAARAWWKRQFHQPPASPAPVVSASDNDLLDF